VSSVDSESESGGGVGEGFGETAFGDVVFGENLLVFLNTLGDVFDFGDLGDVFEFGDLGVFLTGEGIVAS